MENNEQWTCTFASLAVYHGSSCALVAVPKCSYSWNTLWELGYCILPDDGCPVWPKHVAVLPIKSRQTKKLCGGCEYRLQIVIHAHNGMGNPKNK
jgi:hypothetical protein